MDVGIQHFSDVLCVWAYVAQVRCEELTAELGDRVSMQWHYIDLFGDTERKFGEGWAKRGGFEGYAEHVAGVVAQFDHVSLHRDTWRKVRPRSSAVAHGALVATRLIEQAGRVPPGTEARLAWRIRKAFFQQAQDVGRREVLDALVAEQGVDPADLAAMRADGRQQALLSRDYALRTSMGIEGSPTWVLDGGRQKLYGNVGYRVIYANVMELLEEPHRGQASWC